MSIGTLKAKILLTERPKVYYGSGKPVTGTIALTFEPNRKHGSEAISELFGPLKAHVVFNGRIKTKIDKSTGQSKQVYRGRATLFSRTKLIYDDAFKAQPGETQYLPFEIYFPDNLDEGQYASWKKHSGSVDQDLPPTAHASHDGFSNNFNSYVEYRIGCRLGMAGLNVDIEKPEKYGEPQVYYERPRLSQAVDPEPNKVGDFISISNEQLLPEEDRPSGFRAKARAALTANYYPTYAFDYQCYSPRNIHRDQALAFRLTIKPREHLCTAAVVPDVTLSSFGAELYANTTVSGERTFGSDPNAYAEQRVAILKGVLDDDGPFSKANEYTKTINTRALTGLPSSFRTRYISRSYSLKLKFVFHVAGKDKEFEQKRFITIHPPVENCRASGAAGASSSAQPLRMDDGIVALPEYEHPPEYDDATKVPPMPPPKSWHAHVIDESLR